MLHCGRCTFRGWISVAAASLAHYYTMLLLGRVSNELPCDPRVGRAQRGPSWNPRRAISGARQRLRDNFLSFVPNFDTTPEGLIPVAEAQGSQLIPRLPPLRHDLAPLLSRHTKAPASRLGTRSPPKTPRPTAERLDRDSYWTAVCRKQAREEVATKLAGRPLTIRIRRSSPDPRRLACSTVANAVRRYLRPRGTTSHRYTERESTESAPWLALRGETPSCSLG